MASNAEILAQLEKLAKDVALSGDDRACIRNILAAFKRLVKIEEAARAHVDKRRLTGLRVRDLWVAAVARGYDKAFATEHWPTAGVIEEGVDALDAALKEPQ